MYTFIFNTDFIEFILAVEARIAEGWKCQGGVCVFVNGGDMNYYQAMIR